MLGDAEVRVAVAVVRRVRRCAPSEVPVREVLLSCRPAGKSHAGLWEFPGGKIEPGEGIEAALKRELGEELGIEVQVGQSLIELPHRYPNGAVRLFVREVLTFSGDPRPLEGQQLRWIPENALASMDLLPANAAIVAALRLPGQVLITPRVEAVDGLERGIQRAFDRGVRLVVLRQPGLPPAELQQWCAALGRACRRERAKVLLHGDPDALELSSADGIHCPAGVAADLKGRPVDPDKLFGVSCHTPEELERAADLGADYATLSPVAPTATHPKAVPIGWRRFGEWVRAARLPVYALGGMSAMDVSLARSAGGQGVAGIRGLWH